MTEALAAAQHDRLPEAAPGHAHADWKTYVLVGVILTVITAVEVAVFYMPALHPVMIPILLTLSATKFFIVVLWYMHLRYDSHIFRRVFFAPLSLAVLVVCAMLVLFKVLPHFR